MKQECVDSETALQESLRHSKSGLVCVLGQGYRQIEQILQNTKKQLQVQVSDNFDTETATEKKILLAEYALDFAHQAADRALLLSMEAIEAQLLQIKKGESHERS